MVLDNTVVQWNLYLCCVIPTNQVVTSGCKYLSNPPGLPALQVVVETNDTVDA